MRCGLLWLQAPAPVAALFVGPTTLHRSAASWHQCVPRCFSASCCGTMPTYLQGIRIPMFMRSERASQESVQIKGRCFRMGHSCQQQIHQSTLPHLCNTRIISWHAFFSAQTQRSPPKQKECFPHHCIMSKQAGACKQKLEFCTISCCPQITYACMQLQLKVVHPTCFRARGVQKHRWYWWGARRGVCLVIVHVHAVQPFLQACQSTS